MAELEDTIFEERSELVISPGGCDGSDISLKTAHFLKPILKTTNFQLLPHPISAKSATLKDSTVLDVSFKGWRLPKPEWREWVDQMHSKHQSLWRKVGIYEAIMSSKCWIGTNRNVVLGLAERWCSETNTFMFPWGEATLTLEDMMLLGGYPVLGNPFSRPLITLEERTTHDKLVQMLASCNGNKVVTYHMWLKHFMGSGHELEHEAFLSAWLSKYVFPTYFSFNSIGNHVFSIAIHLARGTPIALAPAVLSSIYRDLGFLKGKLVALGEHMTSESLLLYAPFQLVLLWVWERFPVLRPTPKAIASGDPRAARWDKLRSTTSVESVRLAIESAAESFQWRPYASAVKNWAFPNCYGDEEQWIIVGPGLDEEFESIVRCIRTSELVGPGCIQQYLPQRVAQQFGMDQDVPGLVVRRNGSPVIAWSYYVRPIIDAKLYVPPRICRGDVTLEYSEWWRELTEGTRPQIKHYSRKPRSPMSPQDSMTGAAAEGNNPELADLTHVDNAGTKMKQVTEKEGIENVFRSVGTRLRSLGSRKRSRSLAVILEEDNMNDDVDAAFHPESDETKEDGLVEGVEQVCEKVLRENNQDVPPGFARRTTNIGEIPNHVASPANTNSGRQGENSSGMVGVGVEKQVGNGCGTSSGQNAEMGSLQNLEGTLLERARGGNAAATSEIERIWLRLEANVSWIEKRLIEMKKKN